MARLNAAEVAAGLDRHGLAVADDEAVKLAEFLSLLLHWNQVHNLTGIREPAELIDRHLAESLALEPFLVGDSVADIGSGGGLPGIPLAICRSDIQFTLIESRRKRVSFLRHVASTLQLRHVEVAHGRAEALGLPTFANVLARAVAGPRELLAIAEPLVAPAGRLVLLTGVAKGNEIVSLAQGFRQIETLAPGHAATSRIVVLERQLS